MQQVEKQDFKARARALVSKMTFAEKMAQMRFDAPAIERLGIPAYNWWNECLHGVARAGAATVFPQAVGMAASFHPRLLGRVARAISDEARAKYNEFKSFGSTDIYQGLTFWSPNINIFRDPRWGRGHETYGEDPFLTAEMGTAFVKGLQGDDPVWRKLDATLKHYAVHSGPEGVRHSFDAVVGQKDLYETYLSAFRACIEAARPAAVMGAYNRTNGEPCCASKTLLQDILRGEFGFEGYVVSDCGAICDINQHHHITQNEAQSAALAVHHGCDLNCGSAYQFLQAAAASDLIGEDEITAAVERLFEARLRLGMFDEECPYHRIPYSVVECEEHTRLNREIARESIVLLKNDGVLPLRAVRSIAVIGPNADDKGVLLGNYNGTPSRYETLLRGIQDAAQEIGAQVYYARGCDIQEANAAAWAEHPEGEAVLAARRSDVVVLCMGLNPTMEGEEGDAYNGARSGDRESLDLPLSQRRLFEAVAAQGRPMVFVNVSGSAVNLCEQDRLCAAVVQCFYPGAQGGAALADILFGKVSPSGRLPVTFYRRTEDLPPFEEYAMAGRTYRYFDGPVLYSFGHGLSYTRFEYDGLTMARREIPVGESVELSVRLQNAGSMEAAEAVQLYLRDLRPGQPLRRLAGLKKMTLRPGERAEVTFTLDDRALQFIGDDGAARLEPGEYEVFVGAASDARGALRETFKLV